jgi:hypothetical protein
MPASLLRKALIESAWGRSAGTGLRRNCADILSTGLKGIDPDSTDRIETLILQTLNTWQNIHPRTVEAPQYHRISLEGKYRAYPRGLI